MICVARNFQKSSTSKAFKLFKELEIQEAIFFDSFASLCVFMKLAFNYL